jgi:hypothetical protein
VETGRGYQAGVPEKCSDGKVLIIGRTRGKIHADVKHYSVGSQGLEDPVMMALGMARSSGSPVTAKALEA